MTTCKIMVGDVLARLKELPDNSVHCVVTSPPYWQLRNYGIEGQIGLETKPSEYIEKMVTVFEEVRRVLRADGTLWMNMGDNYAGSGKGPSKSLNKNEGRSTGVSKPFSGDGFKPKDLMGMPWRLAFAMQEAGWYLRADIIWEKPSPMPESVKDRPTKAHEYIFLFSKSRKYFYDWKAIQDDVTGNANPRSAAASSFPGEADRDENRRRPSVNPKARVPAGWDTNKGTTHHEKTGRFPRPKQNESFSSAVHKLVEKRNARSVWTIASTPYPEAHFATFPEELPHRCILAGTKIGDTVLDPFSGAGTTGLVAAKLERNYIGIELNPEYAEMSRHRIQTEIGGMFNQVVLT